MHGVAKRRWVFCALITNLGLALGLGRLLGLRLNLGRCVPRLEKAAGFRVGAGRCVPRLEKASEELQELVSESR